MYLSMGGRGEIPPTQPKNYPPRRKIYKVLTTPHHPKQDFAEDGQYFFAPDAPPHPGTQKLDPLRNFFDPPSDLRTLGQVWSLKGEGRSKFFRT